MIFERLIDGTFISLFKKLTKENCCRHARLVCHENRSVTYAPRAITNARGEIDGNLLLEKV